MKGASGSAAVVASRQVTGFGVRRGRSADKGQASIPA